VAAFFMESCVFKSYLEASDLIQILVLGSWRKVYPDGLMVSWYLLKNILILYLRIRACPWAWCLVSHL